MVSVRAYAMAMTTSGTVKDVNRFLFVRAKQMDFGFQLHR